MLKHYEAFDTVALGEGEATFMEIIERLEQGRPVEDVPGTVWRDQNGEIHFASARPRIKQLDTLASIHDAFSFPILITSRGCPFQCTFCGSESQWGHRVTMHSVAYTLDEIAHLVLNKGERSLSIKDDTFTASRKRTLEICRALQEKKWPFVWSCNTRATSLDEEVLRAMRMAGCEMIGLGVESGSPVVLENIKKKVLPEKVLEVTHLARKYGIRVMHYMMMGNRGETIETFQQSVQLLHDARPHQYQFMMLTVVPGTREYEVFIREKELSPDLFFSHDYYATKYGFNDYVTGSTREILTLWKYCYDGGEAFRYPDVEEALAILERLEGLHAAHLDVAAAYLAAGKPDSAEKHVLMALKQDYPLPEFLLNQLACIAAFRGDYDTVERQLLAALAIKRHTFIVENLNRFSAWQAQGGPAGGTLKLIVHHGFPELMQGARQPVIPADIDWKAVGSEAASRI